MIKTKEITWFGRSVTLACDKQCQKAWGINSRPKILFDDDDDDYAFLADDELPNAPDDPGTYEGGCAKPDNPNGMNKWCSRECERSGLFEQGQQIDLPDLSKRLFNQPHKHYE